MKQENVLLLLKWLTWPVRPLMYQILTLHLVLSSQPFDLDDV